MLYLAFPVQEKLKEGKPRNHGLPAADNDSPMEDGGRRSISGDEGITELDYKAKFVVSS